MHSSCSLSKCLVLVNFLVIHIFLIRKVASLNLTNAYLTHKCSDNEKTYESRSEYEKLLKSSIHDIAVGTHKFKSGYTYISSEEPPNSVTILYWCRVDSYGSKCRSCFNTVVAELRRRCNKDSVGIIWYDQCTLEVSGERQKPSKTDYENPLSLHNPKNMIGDINSANKNIIDFLYKLTSQVNRSQTHRNEPINYAMGETKFGTSKVYAMVQCLPITNVALCKDCLESNIKELSKCCNGKQGARVLSTICNVRYELYPFWTSIQKTL